MPPPKPIATWVTCMAALAVFLFAFVDHLTPRAFASLVLVCGLLPAVGVWIDWIRLERPSVDDAFFAGATIAGAAAVGIAPSAVTALWHPVLLGVALTFALRRKVVTGAIVDVEPSQLTLALERGRLRIARDAHRLLGARSPLLLEEGATLALATRLHREQRGTGPFRGAVVLGHGAIAAVAATPAALRTERRARLRLALGLVVVSAVIGWGVAMVHVPMIGTPVDACPYP